MEVVESKGYALVFPVVVEVVSARVGGIFGRAQSVHEVNRRIVAFAVMFLCAAHSDFMQCHPAQSVGVVKGVGGFCRRHWQNRYQ